MRPRIGLVELGVQGHKSVYLREFARTLLNNNIQVEVYAPAEMFNGVWGTLPATSLNLVSCPFGSDENETPTSIPRLINSRIARWRQISQAISGAHESSPLDCVVIMSADDLLAPLIPPMLINLLFSSPVCVLHVNPQWQLGPRFALQDLRIGWLRHDCILRSSRIVSIATLCDAAVEPLRSCFPNTKVCKFPDFCDATLPSEPSRLRQYVQSHKADRLVVTLAGTLSSRKNLHAFVQLASSVPEDKILFVLAGEPTDSFARQAMQEITDRQPTNLLVFSDRIEGESCFNDLLQASDVVWTNYRNFFMSSNLLTKAAMLGKPVLGQDYGTIGHQVTKFNLGWVADPDDLDSMRRVLEGYAESRELPANFGRSQDNSSFVEQNSLERMGKVLLDFLPIDILVPALLPAVLLWR